MNNSTKRTVSFYMYYISIRNLPFIFWLKIVFKILGIPKFLFIPTAKSFLGVLTLWIKKNQPLRTAISYKCSVALGLSHKKFSLIIRKPSVHRLSCYDLLLAIKSSSKLPYIFRFMWKCLKRNCMTNVYVCFSFSSAISLALLQGIIMVKIFLDFHVLSIVFPHRKWNRIDYYHWKLNYKLIYLVFYTWGLILNTYA